MKNNSYYQAIADVSSAQVREDSFIISNQVADMMLRMNPLIELSTRGQFRQDLHLFYLIAANTAGIFSIVNLLPVSDGKVSGRKKLFKLVPQLDDPKLIKGVRPFSDLFNSCDVNYEYLYELETGHNAKDNLIMLNAYRSHLCHLNVALTDKKFGAGYPEMQEQHVLNTFWSLLNNMKRSFTSVKSKVVLMNPKDMHRVHEVEVSSRIFCVEYVIPNEDCFRVIVSEKEEDCKYLPKQETVLESLAYTIGNRLYTYGVDMETSADRQAMKPFLHGSDLDLSKSEFVSANLGGVTIIVTPGVYHFKRQEVIGTAYVIKTHQNLCHLVTKFGLNFNGTSFSYVPYTGYPDFVHVPVKHNDVDFVELCARIRADNTYLATNRNLVDELIRAIDFDGLPSSYLIRLPRFVESVCKHKYSAQVMRLVQAKRDAALHSI